MSAWNLHDQSCGFTYDCTQSLMGFQPRINKTNFVCCFIFIGGFGGFVQKGDEDDLVTGSVSLQVLHVMSSGHSLDLKALQLRTTAHVIEVSVDKSPVDASIKIGGLVQFAQPLSLKKGSTLLICLSRPCCLGQKTSRINEKCRNDKVAKPNLVFHRFARSVMLALLLLSVACLWSRWWTIHFDMPRIVSRTNVFGVG